MSVPTRHEFAIKPRMIRWLVDRAPVVIRLGGDFPIFDEPWPIMDMARKLRGLLADFGRSVAIGDPPNIGMLEYVRTTALQLSLSTAELARKVDEQIEAHRKESE